MAGGTKGRDLKVSFLTDLNQFDAKAAADELDQVADSSTEAGKGLDRLEKDAKATAAGVDKAFDKIRASSKANIGKVDESTKEAGQGLNEFKDEAAGTSREAAASFQGVEDGLSAVQEVAANAFTGFGPAGAAAGLAAAAGIGLLFSALQKSADAANATKDRVIALAGEISDAGGDVSKVDIVANIREWSREIADNKSWWEFWQKANTTNLEKVEKQARKAGVAFENLFEDSGDPQVVAGHLKEINDRLEDNRRNSEAAATAYRRHEDGASRLVVKYAEQRKGLEGLKESYLASAGATEEAIQYAAKEAEALGTTAQAQETAKAAVEAHTDALAGHAQALEGFVSPAGAYTDLLAAKEAAEQASAQATADATEDEKDSWEDFAKSVDVSVGEYLKALERQVQAQAAWSSNLATLAHRGVSEGVLAELEKMGPQGAPLVAKLTKASDAELTKLVTLFGQKGAAGGQAVASNLAAAAGPVGAAGKRVHDAAVVALARKITVPVELEDVTREAQLAWLEADRYFKAHPITIRTKAGSRPIRDTP